MPPTFTQCPLPVRPPISSQAMCRNSQYPIYRAQQDAAIAVNKARKFRVKQIFSASLRLNHLLDSGGTRNRWRFAFHSSPQHQKLKVFVVMAPTNHGSLKVDASTTLTVYKASDGSVLGSVTVHFGATTAAVADVGTNFAWAPVELTGVTADTDCYALFTDDNDGRLVAACVYEVATDATVANGYVRTGGVALAPIMGTDRSTLATAAIAQWKHGAAPIFNWSTDRDTEAVSVTTNSKNIIDGAGSVTAATAGFTFQLSNHARLSQNASGVYCVFAGYGHRTGGTANQQGFRLIDSTTATVLDLTGFTALDGWIYSAPFFLPATKAKYDLWLYATSGTFTAYAASLFEYEA